MVVVKLQNVSIGKHEIHELQQEKKVNRVKDLVDGSGKSCICCEIYSFTKLSEQQEHFRSNLHWYNLQQKQRNRPIVYHEEEMVECTEVNEDYSIEFRQLLHAEEHKTHSSVYQQVDEKFVMEYRVYKNVLLSKSQMKNNENGGSMADAMLQVLNSKLNWIVLLLQSGYFAGGVFDKQQQVVAHKTFQRYTNRKGQGKAQSAHDSGSSGAKSAGATLRRYNEKALQDDIQQLMQSWETHFKNADLIFMSCPKNGRSVFYDQKRPILKKGILLNARGILFIYDIGDDRIRYVPFATQRPTFQEVVRVHDELRSVHVEKIEMDAIMSNTKESMEKVEEEQKDSSPMAIVDTKEVIVEREIVPNAPLLQACLDSDMDAVLNMLASTEVLINERHPDSLMTALHGATIANNAAIVTLLLEHDADPCIQDVQDRVPFFLCTTKVMRDEYRRFRGKNPSRWDYQLARIPDGLTAQAEDEKKEKERLKRKKQRARKQANKLQERQDAIEKAKLDAIHAERIAQSMKCDQCTSPLPKDPLHRLEYKYCSSDCVLQHKRKLMADAAQSRFS